MKFVEVEKHSGLERPDVKEKIKAIASRGNKWLVETGGMGLSSVTEYKIEYGTARGDELDALLSADDEFDVSRVLKSMGDTTDA